MERREGEGRSYQVDGSNLKRKRNVTTNKMEFVGWGSKPLIEFLISIGEDLNQQLSQETVATIINRYVLESNLIHPERKRRVVCDERLYHLFRRKSISRNGILDLLDAHFLENYESSADELLYDSEDYEKDGGLPVKKQCASGLEVKHTIQKEKEFDTSKTYSAAIVLENLKLLYLKRTLIQDLLRNPESFASKLIGSYIRIKSDPNAYLQKNSHQLHPVIGVKIVTKDGDNVDKEVFLLVPHMTEDISIDKLSDCNFSKEECEDLLQRVEDGLLKRPTVGEVQEKAQMLHEHITKHWISRELVHLQNLINRANEKGWRKQIHAYLEQRNLLEKPSEQTRLLLEVPKVIADDLQKEAILQTTYKIM